MTFHTSTEPDAIRARIATELHDYDPDAGNLRSVGQVVPMPADWHRLLLKEFRAALDYEPEYALALAHKRRLDGLPGCSFNSFTSMVPLHRG